MKPKFLKSRLVVWAACSFLISLQATAVLANEEGIQIHGDWTITVLTERGEPAQQHQFKNALEVGGEELLTGLLTGSMRIAQIPPQVSGWGIFISGEGLETVSNACQYIRELFAPPTEALGPPTIVEFDLPSVPTSSRSFSVSRTIAIPAECLSGTQESYSIERVAAFVDVYMDFSPSGPDVPFVVDFSSKTLDTPVTGILPGQQVLLSVNYSFE